MSSSRLENKEPAIILSHYNHVSMMIEMYSVMFPVSSIFKTPIPSLPLFFFSKVQGLRISMNQY